ncbi:hypothetical protein VE02_07223 [Pseudogymnoascus sp. 03VT05]|nr:hypothetical protein VE02_07223 [Pseudogymnoascus sp. 03VT05]
MTDDTPTPTPDRRRGSFSSSTFSAIFGPRGAPTNGTPTNGTPSRPNPSPPSSTTTTTNSTSTTAPLPTPPSRRRMSISTLGLSGSPLSSSAGPATTTFFPRGRRASIASSTASSSLPNSAVSESAIEDDSPDSGSGSVPTTPFSRHMSFGASTGLFPRSGGGGGPTSPQSKSRSPSDAGGLNWSEQFRERAASAVHRPMMGSSPPVAGAGFGSISGQGGQGGGPPPHVRARSEGGDQMVPQQPQTQARAQPVPVPRRKERRKPDEVGERMLRGEFYMD